jgi:GTP-binding protein HflX
VVSAQTGQGIDDLLVIVEATMTRFLQPLHALLPYNRGDLLSLFHERGQVDGEEHGADGIRVYGRIPPRLAPYFEPYRSSE